MQEHELRIVLADDHPVVRLGLKSLIDAQADLSVVGEAGDGRQAYLAVQQLRPDVVVMDLNMPHVNGTQATAQIKHEVPEVKVLILTLHGEAGYVQRILDAGADGYVLKQAASAELIVAIRAVAAGGTYLDPAMVRTLLAPPRGTTRRGMPESLAASLSPRERAVLQGVARGYSNKEIAQQLAISAKTVETYRERSMAKLGLSSRAALVRFALHHGWLDE